MDELLFTGMDILEQTRNVVESATDSVCRGLTTSEKEAYLGGIANTLSALQLLLELDGYDGLIVNIPGLEDIEEMFIDELEEIFLY